MLENSCHPISIPPEIWLSPYFHTSILGHGLSPYFRGPGCHPTSVVLFLFSHLTARANEVLDSNFSTGLVLKELESIYPLVKFKAGRGGRTKSSAKVFTTSTASVQGTRGDSSFGHQAIL